MVSSIPTEADLLAIDLFAGDRDGGGVRRLSNQMVTTRKLHTCRFSEPHPIPLHTRARVEEAIVDDEWQRFYVCTACLVNSLDEEAQHGN